MSHNLSIPVFAFWEIHWCRQKGKRSLDSTCKEHTHDGRADRALHCWLSPNHDSKLKGRRRPWLCSLHTTAWHETWAKTRSNYTDISHCLGWYYKNRQQLSAEIPSRETQGQDSCRTDSEGLVWSGVHSGSIPAALSLYPLHTPA